MQTVFLEDEMSNPIFLKKKNKKKNKKNTSNFLPSRPSIEESTEHYFSSECVWVCETESVLDSVLERERERERGREGGKESLSVCTCAWVGVCMRFL